MALQESYTTGIDAQTPFAQSDYHDGQIWTTTSAYRLASIKIKLYRDVTLNPGNVTMYIYATSGDLPTGSALKTSEAVDCSGITTDSAGEEVEFTFTDGYDVSDATKYAMVILSSNATINNLYWKADSDNGYADGLAVRGGFSTWYSNSAVDHWFETYSATENIDVTGTIASVSNVTGDAFTATAQTVTGTIAGVSSTSGSVTVVADWQTDTFKNTKRLVIAGNDSIYYEDI